MVPTWQGLSCSEVADPVEESRYTAADIRMQTILLMANSSLVDRFLYFLSNESDLMPRF
jgi:hypothetical protein